MIKIKCLALANGNDNAGWCEAISNANPGRIRVTYNMAFTVEPIVVVSPSNPNIGASAYYVDSQTTYFEVILLSNTTGANLKQFSFQVIGVS